MALHLASSSQQQLLRRPQSAVLQPRSIFSSAVPRPCAVHATTPVRSASHHTPRSCSSTSRQHAASHPQPPAEAVSSSSSSSSTATTTATHRSSSWQVPGLAAGVAAAAAALSAAGAADAAQPLAALAELDAGSAHTLESVLRPLFAGFTVLYIIRITMSWYPNIDGRKLPWLLAYAPTEPILRATRNVVPLVGGVDVTPIVWVGLISFLNEILLGPQGILMLIQRQSGAGL